MGGIFFGIWEFTFGIMGHICAHLALGGIGDLGTD